MNCNHQCLGNCRREGCDCVCGEWHCEPQGECQYDREDCPNHPAMKINRIPLTVLAAKLKTLIDRDPKLMTWHNGRVAALSLPSSYLKF